MINNFFDSLLAAAEHRFSRRHCLQVDATQAFVRTWQSKDGAPPHGLRNFVSRSTSRKTNAVRDPQPRGHAFQSPEFGPISNNLAHKIRMRLRQACYCSNQQLVSLARDEIANAQNQRCTCSPDCRCKQIRVDAIVHDAGFGILSSRYDLLSYSFADADHSLRRFVDHLRIPPAPRAHRPSYLRGGKRIQPMY